MEKEEDAASLQELEKSEQFMQRICPNCVKKCMVVLRGVEVFLGRKRKMYEKTVCERCGTEWYLDLKRGDAFTREELEAKYKTYFSSEYE
jgi:C4-type Zn-finger protein